MAEEASGAFWDLAGQLTELKLNEVRDLFAAENIIVSAPSNSLGQLPIPIRNEETTRPRGNFQNQVVAGLETIPEPETHTAEIADAGYVKLEQQQVSCERSGEDAHKIKLIQQQMVLLLHTHRCRQLDAMNSNRQCNLPLCLKLKPVMEHVGDYTGSDDGNNCPFPQCKSSKKLISHWRHCSSNECPVCWPLKLADQNRRRLELERSQRSHTVS